MFKTHVWLVSWHIYLAFVHTSTLRHTNMTFGVLPFTSESGWATCIWGQCSSPHSAGDASHFCSSEPSDRQQWVDSLSHTHTHTHTPFSRTARLRNASDWRVLEAVDGQACVQTEQTPAHLHTADPPCPPNQKTTAHCVRPLCLFLLLDSLTTSTDPILT